LFWRLRFILEIGLALKGHHRLTVNPRIRTIDQNPRRLLETWRLLNVAV